MSKPGERGSRRSGEDRQTLAAGPGAARPQRTCAGGGVALRRDRGAEAGHAISAGSFLDPGLGGPPPSWRLLRRASLERVRGRASLPSRPHAPGSPGSRRQPPGRRLAHSAPILGQAGDSPLGSGAGRGPGPSRPCAAASPAPLPPGRCVPPAAVPPGFERARDPGPWTRSRGVAPPGHQGPLSPRSRSTSWRCAGAGARNLGAQLPGPAGPCSPPSRSPASLLQLPGRGGRRRPWGRRAGVARAAALILPFGPAQPGSAPCTPCTSRRTRPPASSSPCTATSSTTASATSWWPGPRSSTCTASTATPR